MLLLQSAEEVEFVCLDVEESCVIMSFLCVGFSPSAHPRCRGPIVFASLDQLLSVLSRAAILVGMTMVAPPCESSSIAFSLATCEPLSLVLSCFSSREGIF